MVDMAEDRKTTALEKIGAVNAILIGAAFIFIGIDLLTGGRIGAKVTHPTYQDVPYEEMSEEESGEETDEDE